MVVVVVIPTLPPMVKAIFSHVLCYMQDSRSNSNMSRSSSSSNDSKYVGSSDSNGSSSTLTNDALTTSFIEEIVNDSFKPMYLSW